MNKNQKASLIGFTSTLVHMFMAIKVKTGEGL